MIKRLISLSLVFVMFVANFAEACTSIRIKTTDGKVFYARTMEFDPPGNASHPDSISIVPAGTKYFGCLPDGSQKGLAWTTKYGFVGMMLDWIKKGMSEDPNAIVDKMSTTLSGNIANSIQNFAAKHHE